MDKKLRQAALVSFILIAGCTDSSLIVNIPGSAGDSELVTQSRPISDINAVVLSGAGALFITQGDRTELRIRSEQMVLDHLSTTVSGGELLVGFSGTFTLDHTMVLECFLTVESLEKIHLQGLWKVDAAGLAGTPLTVRMDGLGEITLSTLNLPHLDVINRGPGSVTASGLATSLAVELDAAGSYAGGGLISDEADVSIRSAGSATLTVRNRLAAAISGNGYVYYYGDPVVTRTGNGTGSVQRIGG